MTETARSRIERDLDDVAQQRLVALALDLGMARVQQVYKADVTAVVGDVDKEARQTQARLHYLDEAEQWFHKAAEAGHQTAQLNLGILLARRGRLDEARQRLLRVAEADDADLASRAEQALGELSSGGSA